MTNQLSATTTSSATSPITHRFAQKLLTPSVLCPLALLLLVAVLWIPFGLNVGFVSDGWQYYFEADYGGVIPLPLRPFTLAAWRIAYLFSPESFAGFNLLLAGLIYAKALLVFQIVIELKGTVWFAFITAVFCLVIPADTATFWMGTLQVHFALVCFLMAVWALIRYWNTKRVTSLVIMWLTLSLAVGTYEAVFVMAAIVPVLLLIRNPVITRRWIVASLAWYLVPLLAGLRFIYLLLSLPSSGGYQSHLLDLPISPEEFVQSLELLLRRHFLDGWISANFGHNAVYLLLAILVFAVVFAVTQRFVPRIADGGAWSTRILIIAFLIGIVTMVFGAIPFLITTLRLDTERTYFYTSIGAAILMASGMSWLFLHRIFRPSLLALSVATLAGIGIYSQLDQHMYWASWTERQQVTAGVLATNVGTILPATTLVVVDDSVGATDQSLFVSSWYISNLVSVLYQDHSLRVVLCYPELETVWGSHFERCQIGQDSLSLWVQPDEVVHTATYDSIVLVRHLGDNQYVIEPDLSRLGVTSDAYDPFRLIDPSAAPPERLRTLFGIEAGG